MKLGIRFVLFSKWTLISKVLSLIKSQNYSNSQSIKCKNICSCIIKSMFDCLWWRYCNNSILVHIVLLIYRLEIEMKQFNERIYSMIRGNPLDWALSNLTSWKDAQFKNQEFLFPTSQTWSKVENVHKTDFKARKCPHNNAQKIVYFEFTMSTCQYNLDLSTEFDHRVFTCQQYAGFSIKNVLIQAQCELFHKATTM